MTGIAAISHEGKVWIGGDSAAVRQDHYLSYVATPKVFRKGPLVIGYTSSFAMGHALQHRLEVPKGVPASPILAEALDVWMAVDFVDAVRNVLRDCGYMKVDCGREKGGTFIVGIRGMIYEFDDDFHARRVAENHYACGSGVSVILGSLWTSVSDKDPRRRILTALEAAERYTTTVRGPFTLVCEKGCV